MSLGSNESTSVCQRGGQLVLSRIPSIFFFHLSLVCTHHPQLISGVLIICPSICSSVLTLSPRWFHYEPTSLTWHKITQSAQSAQRHPKPFLLHTNSPLILRVQHSLWSEDGKNFQSAFYTSYIDSFLFLKYHVIRTFNIVIFHVMSLLFTRVLQR